MIVSPANVIPMYGSLPNINPKTIPHVRIHRRRWVLFCGAEKVENLSAVTKRLKKKIDRKEYSSLVSP